MGEPDADSSCAANTVCLDLTKPANAPLANVGGSIYVQAAGDRLIVVRVSDTQVDALSSICTHAGCTVNYSTTRMNLGCPCHGSQFNLNGSVARGPAAIALKTYTATLDAANKLVTIAIG
jgi:cytochrome b6-f complex iron-sulfur subunit